MREVTVRAWLLPSRACAAGLVLLAGEVAAQMAECTISATPIDFGVYDPASPAGLGPVTMTVTVGCSVPPGSGNVTGFTASLSLSRGASAQYSERRMTGIRSGERVGYNIYTTANASTIWGDGSGGSVTQPVVIPRMTPGQSGRFNAQAYGFVRPLQDVAVDDYGDTLVVTLSW